MKKKNGNLFRIIWIVGIYAVLVFILYLVILYKVKWEDKDLNTYLYFYDCSNDLCTSQTEVNDFIGKLLCDNDICPFIKEKNDNILIMSNNNKEFLYNYTTDEIINDTYTKYKFTSTDGSYIVCNSSLLCGIIDSEYNILVDLKYSDIKDYKNNYYTYKKDNKYYINNIESGEVNDVSYDDIILINSKYYAYLNDGKYYVTSYENKNINKEYNYVMSIDNYVLVFYNNLVDILDENLNSVLLMKINSFYEYLSESEINSLDISRNEDYIYFKIFTEENKYKNYKFDLNRKKLIN